MVLESTSGSPVRKDAERWRKLYRQAGIREGWLVDARGGSPRWPSCRDSRESAIAAELQQGRHFSTGFRQAFQLIQEVDRLGYLQ